MAPPATQRVLRLAKAMATRRAAGRRVSRDTRGASQGTVAASMAVAATAAEELAVAATAAEEVAVATAVDLAAVMGAVAMALRR